MMPSRADVIFDRIEELGACGYNWDDNGGLPIRPDVLALARIVFEGSDFSHQIMDLLPESDIELQSDGTILVVYADDSEKLLGLQLLCADVVTFFKEEGDTATEGVIYIEEPDYEGLHEIEDLLAWFVSE